MARWKGLAQPTAGAERREGAARVALVALAGPAAGRAAKGAVGTGAGAGTDSIAAADRPRWARGLVVGGFFRGWRSPQGQGSPAPFVAARLAVVRLGRSAGCRRCWWQIQNCAVSARIRASGHRPATGRRERRLRVPLVRAGAGLGARFPVAGRRLRLAGAAGGPLALVRLGRALGRFLRAFGAIALLVHGCWACIRRRCR